MLKRLELVGFKSFADKTTFEFDHGITAIVGPNGSGKSNIVDAVRWILGEQSAKSLRGGEMIDVIFNGSASRRSFGMAEVTLTLDNAKQLLATDSAEVQITRRVYRSGEGEYLINQQVCRLKDIKDLFLGSGAGGHAYCIIAQGQVELMLQASSKERRFIFEEAAGISRFKVKKIETTRKLERVDQNVHRLRDIIDEVEKQLRSVKLQAAKAQRYQEHSARLKELRVGLGLREYHQITEKLDVETAALESLRSNLDQHGSQVTEWEQEHRQLEETLAASEEELHQAESELANARRQIVTHMATLEHEQGLSQDLYHELGRLRKQANELVEHLAGLQGETRDAGRKLSEVQILAVSQRQITDQQEEELRAVEKESEQIQFGIQQDKADHLEQMRESARLQNDAVSYKAQIDNLQRELNRLRRKTEQVTETLASLDGELQEMSAAETNLSDRLHGVREQLEKERQERDRLRQLRDETAEQISAKRQEHSGLVSRAEVLEGLERSHEGLGAGVGELLDLLKEADRTQDANAWKRCIVGMIADFLTVRREYAPLIDLALGDWSQRFLVRDRELLMQSLDELAEPFSGRVSFLPIAGRPGRQSGNGAVDPQQRVFEYSVRGPRQYSGQDEALPDHPGIIARADQLVTCDHSELQELPSLLLEKTIVVRDLTVAQTLAVSHPEHRWVTLQGELLGSDGSLTVGAFHADTGILSRKSELREARERIGELNDRIETMESDLVELRDQVAVSDSRLHTLGQEDQVLAEQATDLRSRLEMHRDRRQGLHEEVTLSRDEIQRIEEEESSLQLGWQQAKEQAAEAERQVAALQQSIEQGEATVRRLEQQRQERRQELTAATVELAKTEERVASMQDSFEKSRASLRQREQEFEQSEQNLQACEARLKESGRTMLTASQSSATWHLEKEAAQRKIVHLQQQRDRDREQRNLLAERLQSVRGEWQQRNEEHHQHQLQANELEHKRDTITERLRDDYEIELAELYRQAAKRGSFENVQSEAEEPNDELENVDAEENADSWIIPADLDSANEEIADIRSKLQRLGSVNLEALGELNKLEIRATTLNAQYEDLTSAKSSLEDIIQKINQDSKRLFSETFEVIRGHFQELFRKLFGGGMADVVLEDENEILDCGIDIIARPPGKELRSLSLMSGGEKTLTAVALLLAIFRSKPSPFCILDEVDAALDEANIGRYADALHDFLEDSHFILITHAKRTMAAADVIYGITMQESGISKRVSVRFEDWPDERNAGNEPRQAAAGS